MRLRSRRFEIVVAVLLAMLMAGALSGTLAQERKITVPASELPDAIKQAIQKAFPGDRILIIEKEVQGDDPGQYDVIVRSGDKEYEVEISPEGKILETKEKAAEDEGAGSAEGKQWTDSFGQEECTFSSLGRNPFFILVPGIGLIQDEDLLLTSFRVVEEEKVSLQDLPRAIRRVIRKHATGGSITEVEKEIVGATVRYEAEVVRDGKEFDIRVSAAGEYLGTEQEEEDEGAEEGD